MPRAKFKLNRAGVRKLLNGAEAHDAVKAGGRAISARAGAGVTSEVVQGRTRVQAQVHTQDTDAGRTAYESHAIEFAVGGLSHGRRR